jgi:hypothetical protein
MEHKTIEELNQAGIYQFTPKNINSYLIKKIDNRIKELVRGQYYFFYLVKKSKSELQLINDEILFLMEIKKILNAPS